MYTLARVLRKIRFIMQYSHVKSWLIKLLWILMLITVLLSYLIFKNYTHSIQDKLMEDADNIDRRITALYQEAFQLASLIGKQVANDNYNDKQRISKILQHLNNLKTTWNIGATWPMIGWIDVHGKMTVHQFSGVLLNPLDVTHRSYFHDGKIDPGKIKIAPPDNSVLIKKDIILPAGFGVVDAQHNFIGMIGLAMAVSTLSDDLTSHLLHKSKFIVCDNQQNVYLASNILLYSKNTNIHKIVGDDIDQISVINMVHLDDDIYLYAKRSATLPMVIFVGYNKYTFWAQISRDIGLVICIFLMISITCILLTLHAISIMIKIINTTEQSSNKFINAMSAKYYHAVLSSDYCKSIADISKTLPSDVQEKIENILQQMMYPTEFSSTFLENYIEFTKVSLNSIINDAIQIKCNDILTNDITVCTKLSDTLPLIFVDPLILKQVIISIISHAIEFPSNFNVISITTYTETDQAGMITVSVLLENIGFGFNDDDISRIRTRLNSSQTNAKYINDYTNLNFQDMIKLIEINNGKCHISHNFAHSNTIHISFISSRL